MAKRKLTRSREDCPNCGSIWAPGSEEWDWQKCDSCGWPDDIEDDYDDDMDEPFEDDDDYDDPNDSRNI